jgi:hypothetical protein
VRQTRHHAHLLHWHLEAKGTKMPQTPKIRETPNGASIKTNQILQGYLIGPSAELAEIRS